MRDPRGDRRDHAEAATNQFSDGRSLDFDNLELSVQLGFGCIVEFGPSCSI